jgi:uncharacterized protein (DUF362 family)
MPPEGILSAGVAVAPVEPAAYPSEPPFHPGLPPREYPFEARHRGSGANAVYDAVRHLWVQLGYDAKRFGTAEWNPLRALVSPGDRVLVKPNLIFETNQAVPGRWEEVVTHPSLIRAVTDYVLLALEGRGEVWIADGPQTDADFDLLVARTGLRSVVKFYEELGLPVKLVDLRRDLWITRGDVIRKRSALPGDPTGYVSVDLGERSAFRDYSLSGRFYGADYDVDETRAFHAGGRHEYVLCGSAMRADVLVGLPKLKTHKKTGVTLALKNLVGVNGYRNCLPHYTLGAPADGGDEFPDRGLKRSIESKAVQGWKRVLRASGGTGGAWAPAVKRLGRTVFGDTSDVVRSGNWQGNDTAWRMVLDLNQAVLWHGADGRRRDAPRRYLAVVDGVIGGEGNGPLAPTPRAAGILVAGTNPLAVDRVATAQMGFDPDAVPLLSRPMEDPAGFAWLLPEGPPSALREGADRSSVRFTPHFGWPVLLGP